MSIKSQEMKRADFAFGYIKNVAAESAEVQKCFKSYVNNVPSYIKTNGLIATYAFIGTKKINNEKKNVPKKEEIAYQEIYNMTRKWLVHEECSVKKIYSKEMIEDDNELMKKFLELSSNDYKLVTKEVMALFSWARRFAVSELKG